MNEIYKKFSDSLNWLGDPLYDDDWLMGAVETNETLEMFDDSRKLWNECRGRREGEIAGFKYLSWESVQIKKGDTRRSMTIVDFGNLRVVLDFDAKYF